jgi:phage terminase small subunit
MIDPIKDRETALKGTAKEFFQRNFDLLVYQKTLTRADLDLLTVCSTIYSDVLFYTQLLEAEKENGVEDLRALGDIAKLKNLAQKTFIQYTQKLGIGAYDRKRVAVIKEKEKGNFLDEVSGK